MLGIDLGSNTMRAVVMNEDFEKIDEFEFIIGAARGLENGGKIGPEAISKLELALGKISEKYDLKLANAYATAAFRKASNTGEIFASLRAKFGVNFSVIDAKTEARLSVLGMKMRLEKLKIAGEFGFCDLGGASCELSFKSEFLSFDFGIISFFERAMGCEFEPKINNLSSLKIKQYLSKKYPKFTLNLRDKKAKLHFQITDKRLLKMAFLAFNETRNIKKSLNKLGIKKLVLNSGVPTTILALKIGLKYAEYDAEKINAKSLSPNEFLKFAIKIAKMSEKQAEISVGAFRKNYLVAGCFLLFALFEKHSLMVIDEGLREGICVEKLKFGQKH